MSLNKTIRYCLALCVLVGSLSARAEDWAHKKALTLDTSASGVEIKEEVSQLPLLVRLHSGNFSFKEAKPDGSDLRFFAADGKTPLKFHLENFDPKNELANAWVGLPKLVPNSAKGSLVVAWGHEKAVSVADAKGTYDAPQILVFHFGEPDAVRDSSGSGNTAKASAATPLAAGPVGPAALFAGGPGITLAASSTLRITATSGLTFSAWIKPTGNDDGSLYVQQDGDRKLAIGVSGGKLYAALDASKASANGPLKPGTWQHVAVVAGGGRVLFYQDGKEAGSAPLALADMAGGASVGEGFKGGMDEVSLAGTARSPAFIKALAASQSADTPMVAFSEEGGEEGGSTSYFSILIGAVTVDGWVVIGLLMVMAAVSFQVMISKAILLARCKKANSRFLAVFKEQAAKLLNPGNEAGNALDQDNNMMKSNIYRLYKVGLGEVAFRFESQARGGRELQLSSAALDAIKASLDAAQVRENQKLNAGMVLLTIAISGGPFLGLLGTVVGVMITFAAIAAAGDVNVNAIAPGIAAALVATVAGLAVAIPALFGYNWLASQIKNITADSQVFVDEFLTKSAELHSL